MLKNEKVKSFPLVLSIYYEYLCLQVLLVDMEN